jgi:3-oxoacyl-[acyl-carrier protein] reductase
MNILITGASRGVGLEIIKVLLREGHTVYAISRTLSEEFKKLQVLFEYKLFFKCVDLSAPEDLHNIVFKEFVKNSIPLHGLINNAAIAYDDIITNLNLNKLDSMYRTNVFSPMMLTKYAIRNMIFNKIKGSVIHISSISAHTGYKGLAMYASSKGALEAFSKNTAREWGGLGIRSNVVVPGFMETSMSDPLSIEQKDRIYKRTSMKISTDIVSVAETVCFLLSDKSISITGQNLHVDNGTI